MLGFVFVSLAVQAVAVRAAYEGCPDLGGIDNPACPVEAFVNGKPKCFAMITAGYSDAFTFLSGDKECEDKYGKGAHLANMYGKSHFEDVRCYMIEQTTLNSARDKKVLLGMDYNPDSGTVRLYNGQVQRRTYWGERGMPLTYGHNMIFRADEKIERSYLLNFGGDKAHKGTRYDRILCEYPSPK